MIEIILEGELNLQDLNIIEKIGQGNSGVVYKGTVNFDNNNNNINFCFSIKEIQLLVGFIQF